MHKYLIVSANVDKYHRPARPRGGIAPSPCAHRISIPIEFRVINSTIIQLIFITLRTLIGDDIARINASCVTQFRNANLTGIFSTRVNFVTKIESRNILFCCLFRCIDGEIVIGLK